MNRNRISLFVTIEGDPEQLGADDAQVADEQVCRREGEDEKSRDATYNRIADMQRSLKECPARAVRA